MNISFIVKTPIGRLMRWHDTQYRIFSERVRAAEANCCIYFGPTPVSKFATKHADMVSLQISTLWGAAAWFGEAWAPVMRVAPSVQVRCETRQLIVEALTMGGAAHEFRELDAVRQWPLLFMHMLESPPDAEDEHRKALAHTLPETPACCIRSANMLYSWTGLSDMAPKFKVLFDDEFHCREQDGKCH